LLGYLKEREEVVPPARSARTTKTRIVNQRKDAVPSVSGTSTVS